MLNTNGLVCPETYDEMNKPIIYQGVYKYKVYVYNYINL